MKDTFEKLNTDQYIESGPTKYDTFRGRSNTVVYPGKIDSVHNRSAISRNDVASLNADDSINAYHLRR